MPGPYRCIRLINRAWENRLYLLPPKKDYHVYITRTKYLSLRIRTTDAKSIGKKNRRKEYKIKERKEKRRKKKKNEKGKKRKEKTREDKRRQDNKRKQGKEKRKKCHTSRRWELTEDGIGLMEGIKIASSIYFGRERNMAKKSERSYAIL